MLKSWISYWWGDNWNPYNGSRAGCHIEFLNLFSWNCLGNGWSSKIMELRMRFKMITIRLIIWSNNRDHILLASTNNKWGHHWLGVQWWYHCTYISVKQWHLCRWDEDQDHRTHKSFHSPSFLQLMKLYKDWER